MYQYVVSAQKPTKVTHVLKGNFLSPHDLNLIICKSTRIEFHTLTADGLVAQFDLGIYGRVSTCKLYKPHGEQCELLFVATEGRQYFVLGYDAKKGKIATRASGEISSMVNRTNENGQFGLIDPDGRVVGLNIFQGQFEIIPLDSRGHLRESFSIRLEEISVIDIQFLHGCSVPTICVLYQDDRNGRQSRHIKTYGISLKEMEFTEGPWSQPSVDIATNMIIPIPEPAGGVLIMGFETISYRNGRASGRTGQAGTTIAIPVRCGMICAYAPIDAEGLRWLLCDEWGGLHVLALQIDRSGNAVSGLSAIGVGGNSVPLSMSSSSSSSQSVSSPKQAATVVDLTMEFLGETSIASSIAYLDNGYVFVGSTYGDSQLIRLLEERDEETDSFIEVIQSCTNLGPIVDFCVVDLDRQGQGQLVTCSGAYKDGSLRVVRNGIGIDEQASVELPGIKSMWSLRKSFGNKFDHYLVQSFISETRILAMEGEELSEVEMGGFSLGEATLFCGNVVGDWFVQVTKTQIRVIGCGNISSTHATWPAPAGRIITVAHGNATQLLISLDGGELVLFKIEMSSGQVEQISTTKLEHEIACINMSPLDAVRSENAMEEDDSTLHPLFEPLSTDIAAVGMWTDVTVRVLAIPSLEVIHKEKLGVETIPRSLCFATLEGHDYLLAGLGDGKLFTFNYIRGGEKDKLLTNKKKITRGSRPITLSKFRSKDAVHIFAGTDRPTIIYSSGSKLLYSNVSQKEVSSTVSFHTEAFPDCLAIASEEELSIGTINEIQKLHIRSHPLGEHPRRICHQKTTHTFAITSVRSGRGNRGAFGADGKKSGADDLAKSSIVPSSGVSSMETDIAENLPDIAEANFVRLLDDSSFELLDSFQMDEFECGCSILSCKFQEENERTNNAEQGNDTTHVSSSSSSSSSRAFENSEQKKSENDKEYIVVGTAYTVEGEQESTKGRILVFEVTDKSLGEDNGDAKNGESTLIRRLVLVAEKQTRGAVYHLNSFNGKLLAGINQKVKLFSFENKGKDQSELVSKCSHNDHIAALFLESRGDFILVGDMMKSVSLLAYRAIDETIEELARDYNSNWMTAISICDEDNYIGAENMMNLFTVQKNNEASTEEGRHMLKVVGEFHLGALVNRFRHGSLVIQDNAQPESSSKRDDKPVDARDILNTTPKPDLLFGTVDGSIGVIADLTEPQFKLLKRLERALSMVIQGVGGLLHKKWRSFTHERKTAPSKGFVDGDLIEAYLDLDLADATKVVDLVNGKTPMSDDEDIASILTAGAAGATSDALTLNLDVDILTRFVEDLSRLH